MNILKRKTLISTLLNIIFIIYASSFLIDSGLSRLCIYLSTILWLIEGNFKEKFNQILNQKVILIYFGIILIFLISLTFFSTNIHQGFWDTKYSNGYKYIFSKNITYFLIAIYISTSLKKNFLKFLLLAFVLQVIYMAMYSYGIYFGYLKGKVDDPVHFVHHVFFSIALSLSFFSLMYFFLKSKNIFIKILIILSCILILIDLFITGGRTGQLSFFIALLFAPYYYITAHKRKSYFYIFFPAAIIFTSIFILYNISDNFHKRVERGVKDINMLVQKGDYNTSLGTRIGFDTVNMHLLLRNSKNFMLGLGMGDSKKTMEDYIRKTDIKKLYILKYDHVHNQFFQIWIDGGILALFLYILLYVYLIKIKVDIYNKLLIITFVSIFLSMSLVDIIYHRATILGLFALFIGYFLATAKYFNPVNSS